MPDLPDTQRSRAVLVGVASYANLDSLDAVRNNLTDLAAELSAQNVWGLPPGNCVVVPDPMSPADMLDPLTDAARTATDTLLFYYAGHGLPPPTGASLYLALPGSDRKRMYTAVPYDHVREVLLNSRARRRIVILDCCYSGLALGPMADPASIIVNEASAEGAFVLAAAAENRTALAPVGWRNTAFTAELLETMRHGIPGAGPLLDLQSIYLHLDYSLKAKGLPIPQKKDRNTAGRVTLIRNQAFHLPAPRRLVIIDCDNVAAALWERYSQAGEGAPGFRNALRGIFADLADLGEAQGFASMTGSPPGALTFAVAEEAGVPITVVGGEGGYRAPVDVVMTAAAVTALPTISELTLVTGDSDFVAVIEQARRLGVPTTVASLPETLSPALAAVADNVIPLAIADPAGTHAGNPDPAMAETTAAEVMKESAGAQVQVLPEALETELTDQDLADELGTMKSSDDITFVLDALDPAQVVRILGLMDDEVAGNALEKLNPGMLAKVLDRANLDLIVRLLNATWWSDKIRLLGLMDQDVAVSVLPQLSQAWTVIADMDPDVAVGILSRLRPEDVSKVLCLSPGTSISPDPLDNLLDHLHPDQVADYLGRIDPGRALKLLASRDLDRADRFFDQMEPASAGGVLSKMEGDAAIAWLGRADPDRAALVIENAENRHAAPLLTRLDPHRMELLLSRMRPARARVLRIAMQHVSGVDLQRNRNAR